MFGLCIAESYYMMGRYRVEWFRTLQALEHVRMQLEPRATSWIFGEEVPKRKEPTTWF